MKLLLLFLAAILARADEGNLKGKTVTADTALISNGTVTFTGLTAGLGGTPLCINVNIVYSGGCGTTGTGVTSTGGVSGFIPVYTGATSITSSSLQDNGTTVTTSEALTVANNVSGTAFYLGATQIINGAGSLGNLVNGTFSGALTAGGNIAGGSYYLGATQIITTGGNIGNIGNVVISGLLTAGGNITGASYYVGATQVIDSSRDIGNVVNLSASGTVTLTGLTSGSGGTAVCLNSNVLYVGGCGAAYSGSGTANVLTKWTGTNSFGNSSITDNGTTITTSEALTVSNNVSGTSYYLGSTQIITAGGNIGNVGNGVFSGNLTASGVISNALNINNNSGGNVNQLHLSYGDGNHFIYSTGTGGNETFFGEYNAGASSGWNFFDTNSNTTVATIFANGNADFAVVVSTDGLPDIEQYGCTSGMADATSCINAAIAANPAIRIPKGTWNIGAWGGNLMLHDNLLIVGDGPGSTLWRTGSLSSSTVGVFDLSNLSNVRITNLFIDGGVTTPAPKDYAVITGPLESDFTQNSTIWLHGGYNITLDHLTIQHTGGYAVLVDATANNVNGVLITENVFQNNRPFLFGTGSDFTYGSWPGGIFWDSDGTSHNIQNLSVTANTFKWSTGNAVWGHANALTLLNKNISVSNNLFQDIGLDGIGAGPVDGYTVAANNFLRIGYPATTDSTTGTAKWFNACLPGTTKAPCSSGFAPSSIPAVAIDSTGAVYDAAITGNTIIAHNGGCIDLDGAAYTEVTGNRCYIPQVGDPEYSDAQPANWGPAVGPNIGSPGLNYMYGLNTGNTNATALGGSFISVIGNNFGWQGGGAIRLYSGNQDQVANNLIQTASTTYYNPITIGPEGIITACNNEVANNHIEYYGSGIPAVFEDPSLGSFQSGCQNKVHDNTLLGNLSQFQKDANSSSISYGASTATSGTCSGSSACDTISQYLISHTQYGSTTIASVINQLEFNGVNYLDRWYTPGGVLMLTLSDDESVRFGNGTLGSLWMGGNQFLDVNRNIFGLSESLTGTLSVTGVGGSSFAGALGVGGNLSTSGLFSQTTNTGNNTFTGSLVSNANMTANSFYIYDVAHSSSAQIVTLYDSGGILCTTSAPCGSLGNIYQINGFGMTLAGTASANVLVSTTVVQAGSGSFIQYRCITAGAGTNKLPAGAVTTDPTSCGTSANMLFYGN